MELKVPIKPKIPESKKNTPVARRIKSPPTLPIVSNTEPATIIAEYKFIKGLVFLASSESLLFLQS